MRIAVYAICLNEQAHVGRFLQCCGGADLVSVADTGSSDGTVAALRDGGAVVHQIAIRPWRFDDARNAALALLPPEIDLCIALDLDEVLSPGWRTALEAEWRPGANRGHYLYAWSHHPDGRPAVEFWSDKIHARAGYRWRHPCHEALYPDRIAEQHVYLKGLRVDHWPDPAKSRAQYLPLLQVAAAENPHNARDAFYLGREYFVRGQHAKAVAELTRYLALPGATWREQNSLAMSMIGRSHIALGAADEGIAWLHRATEAAPAQREGWVDLADALYHQGDWAGCHAAATRALAIVHKPSAGANDPRATGAHPHDLASFSAWKLGCAEESLRHAEAALALEPANKRLAGNLALIRRLSGQTG